MTEAGARGKPSGEAVLVSAIRERPDDQDLWDRFRVRQFPGGRINLDPGTLGTPSQAVRSGVQAFWDDELYAYPSGQLQRGRAEMRRARALAAALWGGEAPALTGGSTEAMRLIALALREHLGGNGPVSVLTSGHEHSGSVAAFERHPGFRCHYIPDEALRDPAAIGALAAAHRPAVLFLSQVTCTIGQVLPVREVAAAVRGPAPDAFVVLDAAQALGLVPPALAGTDFVVASGHKWLFGPPGCGFVWASARARRELRALSWSADLLDPDAPCPGFERAGAHDFSVYAGLAAALDLHATLGPAAVLRRSRTLAAWLARELHQRLQAAGLAHHFFDPWTGEERDAPPSADALLGSVSVAFPTLDPVPACTAVNHSGIHLKAIQEKRPTGRRLNLLRFGAPCYESTARVRRALETLVPLLREHETRRRS